METEEDQNTAPAAFSDRSEWIKFVGPAQAMLGVLVILIALLATILLAGSIGREDEGSSDGFPATFVSSATAYVLFGIILIRCGIGSFNLRRWARDVMLVASCVWLLTRAITTLALVVFGIGAAVSSTETGASTTVTMPMVFLSLLPTPVILALIPGTLAFFYSRPSVKRTFLHYDPDPCWTDACPLPVLGLSFWYLLDALSHASIAALGEATSFRTELTGARAVLFMLFFAAVYLYIARGLYKLRMHAWCLAIALVSYRMLSSAVHSAPEDVADAYLGWAFGGGTALVKLFYLLFVLKFFRTGKKSGEREPGAAAYPSGSGDG